MWNFNKISKTNVFNVQFGDRLTQSLMTRHLGNYFFFMWKWVLLKRTIRDSGHSFNMKMPSSQQCNSQSSFLHNRNYFTDNTHTVCQNRDPHRPASNIRRTKYQNLNAPTTSEWSTVLLSAKVRLISVVWGYIETGQVFICLFQWGDTKNVFVFYFIPWHFKQVVEIHAEEIKVYVSKIGL